LPKRRGKHERRRTNQDQALRTSLRLPDRDHDLFCAEHNAKRTKVGRKPEALKVFCVTFSQVCGCVRIKAASAKEASIIARDNYERGELTAENADLRLLPEGKSIEATFYDPGDNPPYIAGVEEEEEQHE